MKRTILVWQFLGFAAVSLLGVLLHFLYTWVPSPLTAVVSAVNESTWEHMKLLFFPMLLVTLVQAVYLRKALPSFWCTKFKGTLLGLFLIPILFYTLRGIFGLTPDWVNILLFFVSAASAFLYETKQFQTEASPCKAPFLAILLFCFLTLSFALFPFYPPEIPLFQDPIGGGFGILGL